MSSLGPFPAEIWTAILTRVQNRAKLDLLWDSVCDEKPIRDAEQVAGKSIFSVALASRAMADIALPVLYDYQTRGGNFAWLAESVISSISGRTAYPYYCFINSLEIEEIMCWLIYPISSRRGLVRLHLQDRDTEEQHTKRALRDAQITHTYVESLASRIKDEAAKGTRIQLRGLNARGVGERSPIGSLFLGWVRHLELTVVCVDIGKSLALGCPLLDSLMLVRLTDHELDRGVPCNSFQKLEGFFTAIEALSLKELYFEHCGQEIRGPYFEHYSQESRERRRVKEGEGMGLILQLICRTQPSLVGLGFDVHPAAFGPMPKLDHLPHLKSLRFNMAETNRRVLGAAGLSDEMTSECSITLGQWMAECLELKRVRVRTLGTKGMAILLQSPVRLHHLSYANANLDETLFAALAHQRDLRFLKLAFEWPATHVSSTEPRAPIPTATLATHLASCHNLRRLLLPSRLPLEAHEIGWLATSQALRPTLKLVDMAVRSDQDPGSSDAALAHLACFPELRRLELYTSSSNGFSDQAVYDFFDTHPRGRLAPPLKIQRYFSEWLDHFQNHGINVLLRVLVTAQRPQSVDPRLRLHRLERKLERRGPQILVDGPMWG